MRFRGGPVWGAMVALFVLGGAPRAACAAESDAARQEAQARFSEGLHRARAGDYEGALTSFTEAYAVWRAPRVLFNVARCEEKLGRWIDARKHYKQVAEEGATAEDDRAEAKLRLDALAAHVARIEIVGSPSSRVSLDDGPVAGVIPLPDPVDVSPGRHTVTARLGPDTRSAVVDAPAGGTVTVRLEFVSPTEAPAAPAPAPAVREARPGASAHAPPAAPEVSHMKVVATAALAGAAVAGVAGGILLALESQASSRTAAGLRGNEPSDACDSVTSAHCAALDDAVQTARRQSLASDIFYVAGGVLGAGALATWLLWPKTKSARAAIWATPDGGRRMVGLRLGGRF